MNSRRARLLCRTGRLAGATYDLGSENSVGRDDTNDVVLLAETVSGRHAKIFLRDGAFFLQDLESRNGTQVDGIPVTDTVELNTLNVITFSGAFDFVFQTVGSKLAPNVSAPQPSEEPAAATTGPSSIDGSTEPRDEEPQLGKAADVIVPGAATPTPPTESMTRVDLDAFEPLPDLDAALPPPEGAGARSPTESAFYLVVLVPGNSEQEFRLKRGDNTVGRSDDCDVVVNHESLSRQHAAVTVTLEGLVLKDLGSTNGTFLDGREVSETVIPHDARFLLGADIEARVEKR